MEWGEIFTNKHIPEFAIKEKHELAGPVPRLEDLSHDKGGETAWSQGGQCGVGAPLPPAPGQLTAHCAVLLAVWVQGPLTIHTQRDHYQGDPIADIHKCMHDIY